MSVKSSLNDSSYTFIFITVNEIPSKTLRISEGFGYFTFNSSVSEGFPVVWNQIP
jgi:hypothetical protein